MTTTTQRPKKFILNPEWKEDERTLEKFKQHLFESCFMPLEYEHEMMCYFPQDFGLDIGEQGNWIMVLHVPPTAIKIPRFSMWFAVSDPAEHAHPEFGYFRQRVRIQTPDGPLWLWPFEYSRIKDITSWIGMEPDVTIHWLNDRAEVDRAQLFYLQQRGIGRREALLMLLPEIHDQNLLYLTVDQFYVDYFTRSQL